jgi:hypothetical protein
MRSRLTENFLIGVVAWLAVMFCVYGPIFTWHVAKTAYDDHEWSVAKIGSEDHEIETLKQKLMDVEKRKPLQKDRCVWKSYAMRPPRDVNGAMSTNETWIVCSYALNPPYGINIKYNEHPFSLVTPPSFPPDVNVGEPLMIWGEGNEWKMIVNSAPPLPAWSVFMFSVYGKNSQPPAVVSVTINSTSKNTIPSGGVVSH